MMMDAFKNFLRDQSEPAEKQLTAFGAFMSLMWIFIAPQVAMSLIGGAYLMPLAIPIYLLFSIPSFPAGVGLMLGLSFKQASILGWLVYISLFAAGIRLRNTRAFRTITFAMIVFVVINVAGCYVKMNSPESPASNFSSLTPQSTNS